MIKNIIYYTDGSLNKDIAELCKKRLLSAANGIPIISVSQEPINLGHNICIGKQPRSLHTMWKQILTGLMYSDADVVYMVEHDVLYHATHFEFEPKENTVFYYNNSIWLVRTRDGRCLWKNNLCFSQCVSNRLLMLDNMMQRVKWCENGGVAPLHQGAYEPGRIRKKYQDERKIFGINLDRKWRLERFETFPPCIDIRHGKNFSGTRRFKIRGEDINRAKNLPDGSKQVKERIYAKYIPGWGSPFKRFNEWIREVA